jgi:hypothetical protein
VEELTLIVRNLAGGEAMDTWSMCCPFSVVRQPPTGASYPSSGWNQHSPVGPVRGAQKKWRVFPAIQACVLKDLNR